ncbi:MAG TPA: glycosyltransferase family 4 protein [Acidimicrobiales bacterium]|nr:glycosyltransferase family 4 protein [Acidimicrobiales bacterium]
MQDRQSSPRPDAQPRALRLACYLDASKQGGSSASLAVLLGALGPDIDVTVLGTSEEIVSWVASARPGTATHVVSPVRSKFDLRSIREHVRAVRHIKPDILHVNLDNPFTAPYGLLAGVLTRTVTIAVVHSATPAWNRRQQWLVRLIAPRVDAYVAVSGAVARTTESLLGLPTGSARVIYNGAQPPSSLATRDATPAPLVGAVGRLAQEKGYPVLLQALRALPGCRLVFVGDGVDRAGLEAQVDELELTERVTFAGWVEPPWTARWAVDVLAVPSFTEGFPLVIVEAMLAGIPVVASNVGGIPEMVVDGETGLLVPPGDAPALAAALERLLGDPELRAAVAARSRSVAEQSYTASAMAKNFEALYRRLRH